LAEEAEGDLGLGERAKDKKTMAFEMYVRQTNTTHIRTMHLQTFQVKVPAVSIYFISYRQKLTSLNGKPFFRGRRGKRILTWWWP